MCALRSADPSLQLCAVPRAPISDVERGEWECTFWCPRAQWDNQWWHHLCGCMPAQGKLGSPCQTCQWTLLLSVEDEHAFKDMNKLCWMRTHLLYRYELSIDRWPPWQVLNKDQGPLKCGWLSASGCYDCSFLWSLRPLVHWLAITHWLSSLHSPRMSYT